MSKRILVIGDVMLDEYLRGHARRISPEAPVPVVEIERRTYFPGGAANVAANVASLGGTALMASVVGDDPRAEVLRRELAVSGVHAAAVLTEPGRCTTSKSRVLAGSHQIVRFDQETALPITAATELALLAAIESVGNVDGYVLSDYAKGVLTGNVCQHVIQLARARGVPVVVDPKGTDLARYHAATVITPNLQEAYAAAQKLGNGPITEDGSNAQIETIAAILQKAACASVLITRGAEGMTLAQLAAAPIHIPARAQQVFDVTGAGDTVAAALILWLAEGASLEEAAAAGNLAAGIAVGKVGTSAITRAELESAGVALHR